MHERQAVLQRFYRGEGTQSHQLTGTPGSGLGLSIVKEVVQAHGGHIQLDTGRGDAGYRPQLVSVTLLTIKSNTDANRRTSQRFFTKLWRMRIVGTHNRSEIELDPQKAWQRCKALDAMLRAALPPHPRGVWRLTHAEMNHLDFEHQLTQAAKVNPR